MQKILCIIPKKSEIRRLLLIMKSMAVIVFLSVDLLYAGNSGGIADATQQGIIITGTVVDETGETLPGVSVQVKGTTIGNITDIDGKYQIRIPNENSVLIFSFVGFTTTEVRAGIQRVINVTLRESTTEIGEVVVVGYGTQKKASVVGAITATSAEILAKAGNPTNLAHALTGNLPGVTTIVHTGEPGNDDPKKLPIIPRSSGSPRVLRVPAPSARLRAPLPDGRGLATNRRTNDGVRYPSPGLTKRPTVPADMSKSASSPVVYRVRGSGKPR
jgi:hypothetical protein